MTIDWDYTLLEQLIQDRGDSVVWETAVACFCRSDDAIASMTTKEKQPSTSRRLYCTDCGGDGYMYRNAQCIKGLVTSISASTHRRLIEGGYAVPGDCVFSPSLNTCPIGDFDKITFTFPDFINDGQSIMRNAAYHNENQGIPFGLTRDEDRLFYQPAQAIWCEDSNHVVYSQGADFILEDKLIRWVGKRPADGVFYVLKYTAYLEWICYNTPLLRMDNARSLAQRVLLRKKHVAFSSGSPADTAAKRAMEQESLITRTQI